MLVQWPGRWAGCWQRGREAWAREAQAGRDSRSGVYVLLAGMTTLATLHHLRLDAGGHAQTMCHSLPLRAMSRLDRWRVCKSLKRMRIPSVCRAYSFTTSTPRSRSHLSPTSPRQPYTLRSMSFNGQIISIQRVSSSFGSRGGSRRRIENRQHSRTCPAGSRSSGLDPSANQKGCTHLSISLRARGGSERLW